VAPQLSQLVPVSIQRKGTADPLQQSSFWHFKTARIPIFTEHQLGRLYPGLHASQEIGIKSQLTILIVKKRATIKSKHLFFDYIQVYT